MTSDNPPEKEAVDKPPSGNSSNGSGGNSAVEKKGLLAAATSKHADIGLVAPNTIAKFTSKKRPTRTDLVAASEKYTAIPLETIELHAGHILFDDFIVSGKVGAGRASVVYRVSQKSTGQILAVKTTKHQEVFVQHAFLKAAKTIMALDHMNLPASVTLLESPLGRPFYFMEFIDGVTLVELIDSTGPLEDIDEIAEIVVQICDALIYAHANKIAHGDLTANNVMLSDTSEEILVKVLDFGFANVIDEVDKAEGRVAADAPAHEERPFEHQIQDDIMMLAQVVIGIVTGTAIPETPPTAPVSLRTTYDEDPNFPYGALEALLNKALGPELTWRFHTVDEFKTAFESWYDKASAEEAIEEEVQAEQEAAAGADVVAPAPKPPRRNPRQTSVRLQVLELANLRKNQVLKEESLEIAFTGAFATQGPRQSPIKTVATLTAKIVTAALVGVLSLTFLILNWDRLGELWFDASTHLALALPGKHNEEIRQRIAEEKALRAAKALEAEEQKNLAPLTATAKGQAGSGPKPAAPVPEQKRFRYEEHVLYKNWNLKEVGPKRRITKSRQ